VRIPAGVEEGSQIRISGEGEMGLYGGGRGNLYIVLSVQEHPLFRRDGDHILLDLDVSFAQAALGDEMQVPTLEGEKPLKIPAGTQAGHLFVLKKHGVPHVRGGGRGDMIVRVNVVTPTHLTDEQKRLLKELDQSLQAHGHGSDGKGFMGRVKETFGG
jgi:molecular chaperone DnaJ